MLASRLAEDRSTACMHTPRMAMLVTEGVSGVIDCHGWRQAGCGNYLTRETSPPAV